jgi:hypothetical protein
MCYRQQINVVQFVHWGGSVAEVSRFHVPRETIDSVLRGMGALDASIIRTKKCSVNLTKSSPFVMQNKYLKEG